MIYPSRRAILIAALGAPVSLAVGLAAPGLWPFAAGWVALVGGLVLLDAVLGVDRSALRLGLKIPRVMGVGAAEEAAVEARFDRGRAPPRVQLSLEANPRLKAEPRDQSVDVEADGARADFRIRPVRRGEGVIERVWARWTGPLGLVWKQRAEDPEAVTAVIPDIESVRREAMRMYSRDAQFGMKAQIDRGDGSEFQSLADFQAGMDKRAIDWKQSARHARLLAKEYRTERNHHIILALDAGRVMSEPLGGLPRIDRALNAGLLLAYVGLKMGDRVGLFAFDSRPRVSTGALAGAGSFPLIQKVASQIDYSTEEANYTLGLSTLAGELKRRSLVVVFTEFVDTTSAELMIENLGRLLKRHLVLFVAFRDEELESLAAMEPASAEDVSRAVIAAAMLKERDLVIARLRRLGVHVLEVRAEGLGPDLVNRYLDLKRRELV